MAKLTPEEKLNKKEHNFKAKQPKQKAQTAFKAITAPSVPEIVQPTVSELPKYRYLCDACSNNAFEATYRGGGLVKNCKSCGKTFYTKLENYLLMK